MLLHTPGGKQCFIVSSGLNNLESIFFLVIRVVNPKDNPNGTIDKF
jgi:hypothetical protein